MGVRNVTENVKDTGTDRVICARGAHFLIPIMVYMLVGKTQLVSAQTNQTDSLSIIEKIVEKQDTMVRSREPLPELSGRPIILVKPIDSVLFRNYNTRFKKELYNLLFKNGSRIAPRRRAPITNITLAVMDGKIIRNIGFDNTDIFAPSVTDTGYSPSAWFDRTVNLTHNDTRKGILKRYLLFKPGDPFDVFLAAENERILRELSFIMDARFIATRVEGSPDSVDLLLLTQDKLPIGIEAEMVKSTLATLGMSHQNILGFGHQFTTTTYWDMENHPHIGYRLAYGTANVAGTFATGEAQYIHKWDQETVIVNFSRDFRTASFRNAGGLLFEHTGILRNIELLDTTLYNVDLKYTNTDFWAGHMLPLKVRSPTMRSGLFVAGRLHQYENYEGPETNDEYLYTCQDKTLLLFSAGYTRQGFRKDNLIYTFGRTEDVPSGYLFNFTLGKEWGQYKMRPYAAIGTSYGAYFKNSSYLSAQVEFGSFLYRGELEQGAFRAQLRYFSPLYYHQRFQYRNFLSLTYLHGINRYTGEFTSIANQGGINGLSSLSLRGRDKIVLNMESVLFSPWALLGFRFAFFGAVDLGLVVQENLNLKNTGIFSGISGGVRIRNDQLVFDTFVIRVGFYPGSPNDSSIRNFIMDSMPRVKFTNFFPYKPALVNYQ